MTDDKGYTMTNVRLFEKLIRGLISYYPGAPDYAFPNVKFKVVKCYMSSFQYKSYEAVYSQEGNVSFKNILKLPNNFLIGPRIISNIAFPNKLIGEDGFTSLKPSTLNNIEQYSIKFYKIFQKVNKLRGTCFIYSNFKEYGGLSSFIKVLEYNGYKNFMDNGIGKNRFAIWSGDETITNKEKIRTIFNDYNNRHGKMIKIILGSPAMKEGVSLMRVKQVHIIEPYWNISRLEQIKGRAVRFCSHKDVDKEEREVKIYLYLACAPKSKSDIITVDEHIYKMAMVKEQLINQFYTSIKRNAIDYYLFNNEKN